MSIEYVPLLAKIDFFLINLFRKVSLMVPSFAKEVIKHELCMYLFNPDSIYE